MQQGGIGLMYVALAMVRSKVKSCGCLQNVAIFSIVLYQNRKAFSRTSL